MAGLELGGEVGHRLEPLAVILGHRLLDRPIEARRHVGPSVTDTGHGVVHVAHRDRDEVVAGEGNLAGEQLVEHAAERVDVGLLVDRLAAGLLRRDVVARPHDRARDRHPVDVDRMGDAEVGHLRSAVGVEQHVLRLDVAVDEPLIVREREPARDLQRKLDRLARAQWALLRHQLLQVHPVDVLEDDELPAVLLAPVDHRDDVRMGQLRDGARFPAKALDVVVVPRELLVQDLQRDRPLEQPVVRAVDARHAT